MPALTPFDRPVAPDPVGESLHYLRIDGSFYGHSELTAPWGVSLEAMPGSIWFHVPTAGRCRIEVDAEPGSEAATIELKAGELALVPHGTGHRLLSEPGVATPDILEIDRELIGDRYERLEHGGGGEPTTLICGAVRFDHPTARSVAELMPSILPVRAEDPAGTGWLRSTLSLIAAEATAQRPGGEAVITRLSDVLVIQAIRAWLEDDSASRRGWLGALRDPQIGATVALMHREPERSWTLAELASEAAMSRSAFVARFSELVGEPPMQHLARRRMDLARDALERDGGTVAELAGRFGYRSEAAFSRAFKRIIGIPPGAARRVASSA